MIQNTVNLTLFKGSKVGGNLQRAAPLGDHELKGPRTLHLKDLSLSIARGELVVVCGPVGSGKTTILDAVLGASDTHGPQHLPSPFSTPTPRGYVDGRHPESLTSSHHIDRATHPLLSPVARPPPTGEAALVEGEMRVAEGARMAYCTQKPWIQAGTVRDNIVFNTTPFDPARSVAGASVVGAGAEVEAHGGCAERVCWGAAGVRVFACVSVF
jgi:energy-coupling factor transporter ATP-binding protein EcfA2